jgi:hypothetical protein
MSLLLLMLAVRPRGWLHRVQHTEAMIDHLADNKAHGALVAVGDPLDTLRNIARDPSINPDVKPLFPHDTAVPVCRTFADMR